MSYRLLEIVSMGNSCIVCMIWRCSAGCWPLVLLCMKSRQQCRDEFALPASFICRVLDGEC